MAASGMKGPSETPSEFEQMILEIAASEAIVRTMTTSASDRLRTIVPPPATRSRLTIEIVDGVTVIAFSGTKIVNEEDVVLVADQLSALVQNLQAPNILMDFGNIEYFTSAGLWPILQLRRMVGAKRGKLKLCRVQPKIFSAFQITHLNEIFEIYPTEAEALAKFTSET